MDTIKLKVPLYSEFYGVTLVPFKCEYCVVGPHRLLSVGCYANRDGSCRVKYYTDCECYGYDDGVFVAENIFATREEAEAEASARNAK